MQREPSTRQIVEPACILQWDSSNVKLAKLGKSCTVTIKIQKKIGTAKEVAVMGLKL